MRRDGLALTCGVAFLLGVLLSHVLPATAEEGRLGAPSRKPREHGPPAPPEVLRALRAVAAAEDRYRAAEKALGRDGFGSLAALEAAHLMGPGASTVGTWHLDVHASPGVPGPIWIARCGPWVANENGLLFWIQGDFEGPW